MRFRWKIAALVENRLQFADEFGARLIITARRDAKRINKVKDWWSHPAAENRLQVSCPQFTAIDSPHTTGYPEYSKGKLDIILILILLASSIWETERKTFNIIFNSILLTTPI